MSESKKNFWKLINQYKFEIFYWFIFIVLSFFMGFKDFSIGTDSLAYKGFFEAIKKGRLNIVNDKIEIGFSLYYYLLCKIGFTYLGAQIITALFVNITYFFIIKGLSKNKFLSLFLYVTSSIYFFAFNGVRQAIAICFILYGIYAINKNKCKNWWIYLLFVIVASLFHMSALMFIPIIFVFYCDLDWFKSLIMLSIITIIMLFAKPIISFLVENFNIKYLEKYVNSSYYNEKVDLNSILLTCGYVFIAVFILAYEKLQKVKLEKTWVKNVFIIAVVTRFCSLFGIFPYLFTRVFDLFSWSLILLIPELIIIIKNKKLKTIIYIAVFAAFLFLFIVQIFVLKNADIFPYKFIFGG